MDSLGTRQRRVSYLDPKRNSRSLSSYSSPKVPLSRLSDVAVFAVKGQTKGRTFAMRVVVRAAKDKNGALYAHSNFHPILGPSDRATVPYDTMDGRVDR
jgi:hypothetical protein